MVQKIENKITPTQLEYLNSPKGSEILRCKEFFFPEELSRFAPNLPKCIDMRYADGIQPSILSLEAEQTEKGQLWQLSSSGIACQGRNPRIKILSSWHP